MGHSILVSPVGKLGPDPTARSDLRLRQPGSASRLESVPIRSAARPVHRRARPDQGGCSARSGHDQLHGAVPRSRLLEMGAVDIIMPDLQKAGGLGEGQRIANLANLYYVPFAPHMVASYLGAMAACHVCASVPNFMILEWQIYFHTDPMFKEIVTFEGNMVEKGFIPLSEKPGIGVDINEEGMKKYATAGYPFMK